MKKFLHPNSREEIRNRLMFLAGSFLFIYSLILTLSPASLARTWHVDFRWSHWLGFLIWCAVFSLLNYRLNRRLPDSDPYLLPVVSILSGWGILTIWRLMPVFGIRQAVWLLVSGLVVSIGLVFSPELKFLKKYKYLWLSGGILLTALTLVFGTNPEGDGLHLWLGCCGVYLQPSEPLKLLFLVYLAAYLSESRLLRGNFLSLLLPTLIITGLALLLLVFQRDLGTASIFIFLYTITLFLSTGRKRILIISLPTLAIAGVIGYKLFDVVRIRIDAWLNPWIDPSGRSFQVVQSIMAIANGGVSGRGPGLGSPGLVPVSISDFIFTAISEETGLLGALGLIALTAILVFRGFSIAMNARDKFRRILAASLAVYFAAQTILIIGGNTRLLPLTGVTLPFVSYGGSSFLTSFVALLLLLLISNRDESEPETFYLKQPFFITGLLLGIGFFSLALTTGWWAVWRGQDLLARTDNARRTIHDRYVQRGDILDRNEKPINITKGDPAGYYRVYEYPDLSPIVGYTHPNYGQSGLEASLDPYLRGLQGNPARLIWKDHLLYGQPPPGIDIRLSLDLDLQKKADFLLGNRKGAIVVMYAGSGEILVMSSHPTFDANLLDTIGGELLKDPGSPLLNRAVQGTYPLGDGILPFYQAAGIESPLLAGELEGLYSALGFFTIPELHLPVADATTNIDQMTISPLQMAIASASLSAEGICPAPRLAMAAKIPSEGWVIIQSQGESSIAFLPEKAIETANYYAITGTPFWQYTATANNDQQDFTWSIGGTLPEWQGAPLVVVVLLETEYPVLSEYIANELLVVLTSQ